MFGHVTINQLVAFLGLMLATVVFALLNKYGAPIRICWGAAILCILVVSVFWSAVNLAVEDDDED